MASERPQEAVSELSHESYLIKQKIRLAEFSTSPGDIATARMQSSASLLESIHKSRDQYQSFSNVQHLILPPHPASLLKTKMDILQTLKSSLEQACNADSHLPQSTKEFLQNVTMRDVDARISEDSPHLEAARAQEEKWSRSEHNIHNKYFKLCHDLQYLVASPEGCPRFVEKLTILYWIAVIVLTFLFKDPSQQSEAVELEMKHDFDVHMFDLFLVFSGAMFAFAFATSVQLNGLRRRPLDRFYAPSWGSCVFITAMLWAIGSMAYMVFRESVRQFK
ncbi:MAG: hypothetical protein OHK93_003710 [Ramalina farinacea]|uniref:Uncharacterized protein n=1 Tax=Ramalina farinacea TaxID=258253 RepID=A0AA43TUX0_9LECA|nr:hypothetical protein [Ramalina farinacea]